MTKHDVQKIAALARLKIPDAELDRYAHQLSSILEYIGKLNEVNTDEAPMTSQVTGLANVFRKDRVEECSSKDDLINMAPDRENRGVKVKRVF